MSCLSPLVHNLKVCPTLPPFHSLPNRHRVNSEYKKRLRSLREISGECRTWPANEDAAVLLRELPVSQERGVTRPLTHDSVCLVSDTERQPAGDMGREERAEKSEGRLRQGWLDGRKNVG